MTEPVDVRNETNPEEEILKEIKETDWTEDTLEYVEPEDFDVGDLECVDEENGEKRNDERRRIKEADQNERRRLEGRYNPYKIPSSHTNRRDPAKKPKSAKHSPARIARDRKRRREFYERKKAQRSEGIDLDELEEVDSCEFDDGTPSDSISTPSLSESTASSPAPDNDEDDPWTKNISTIPLLDDEDFPSLCEEIDPDILKKAAHNQNPTEEMSITPSKTIENGKEEKIEENSGPTKQTNTHNSSSKRSHSPIIRRKQSPHAKKDRSPRRRSRSIDISPWRTWNDRKETRRRRESRSRDRVDRRRHHPAIGRKIAETRTHRHDKSTERRGEEQALNHKDSAQHKLIHIRRERRSTSPKTKKNRQDSRHPRPPTSGQIRDYVIELDSRKSRKPTENERRKTSNSRRPRSDHERLPVRRA